MKTKFFSKIKKAIFNIEDYQEFSIEKTWTAISYVLKLMLIFTIIATVSIAYKSYNVMKQISEKFEKSDNYFYFENNKLSSNRESEIFTDDSNMVSLIITTTEKDIDKNESNIYVMALSDRIKIEYYGTTFFEGKYEEISKTFNINEINKENIISVLKNDGNYKKILITGIIITGIVIYIEFTVQLLVSSLMLAILGFIITRITIIKFKFKPIWNLSIYALTLSTILYLIYIVINVFTGFTIKYFIYAYDAISYIYLITAILMIKSALIKQQIEISKIIEEQKKVKEENKEEEQPKEEKKEKKKKEKEEKDDKQQEPRGNET